MHTKDKPESAFKQAKAMHKADDEAHKQATDALADERYFAPSSKQLAKDYQKAKAMKWWSYLVGFGIGAILTGISLAIDYTVGIGQANYFNYAVMAGLIVFMMGLNWWKNREAAKFFNDRRRRYQRTLTMGEARIFLVLKTTFFGLILFLPAMISLGVMWG